MSRARGWLCIALAAAFTGLMLGYVLPWVGRNGYAGAVIQDNYSYDRDASALFYSESDRVWEILRNTPGDARGF